MTLKQTDLLINSHQKTVKAQIHASEERKGTKKIGNHDFVAHSALQITFNSQMLSIVSISKNILYCTVQCIYFLNSIFCRFLLRKRHRSSKNIIDIIKSKKLKSFSLETCIKSHLNILILVIVVSDSKE